MQNLVLPVRPQAPEKQAGYSMSHSPEGLSAPRSLLPDVRRIVTGHDRDGKACIACDEVLKFKDMRQGNRSLSVWVTDSTPATDNNDLSIDGAGRQIPGLGLVMPNGTNFRYSDIAPGHGAPMHRTTSVDYNIIISGEIVHITENGDERILKAGDVLIQRGTLHAWRNPSTTEWVRMLSVLVDAEPAIINKLEMIEEWRAS